MRRLCLALWPAGVALGIVAEWVGRPEFVALDAAAGFLLVGLGLSAWMLRPRSWAGPLAALTGFAWFAGTFSGWAVYLHRAPLAHLILVYPAARLVPGSRLERVAIVAAYAYAVAYPAGADDYATIAFASALVALSLRRFAFARGPERRRCGVALAAAVAFGGVLVLAVTTRLADTGGARTVLGLYDIIVALVAVGLVADLLFGRSAQSTVTGLVVDLGDPARGSLRERLARTLGDPTLIVAYWLPERHLYVDEAGSPVELPQAGEGQKVTSIEDGGTAIAALIHDPAVLDDPELVSGVAAATRLAVSNARLQADVRTRTDEVEASRRRIVEAADEQRRRLVQELREGAERRLARVAELVAGVEPEVREQLVAAREELRSLAQGIHPAALTDQGLGPAVKELAARSPVPVEVVVPAARFPALIETAAYFVCAEGLANVIKHARASRASVSVAVDAGWLVLEVADDGVGGADGPAGSGIRGMVDRIETLGGEVSLASKTGRGTRLAARLPLRERGGAAAIRATAPPNDEPASRAPTQAGGSAD